MMFINDKLGHSKQQYNYLNVDASPGDNYYKLLQIDNDGNVKELGIKSVNFSLEECSDIRFCPTKSASIVNVKFESNTYSMLTLMDLNGSVILKKEISIAESKMILNVTGLPAAIYIIALKGVQST